MKGIDEADATSTADEPQGPPLGAELEFLRLLWAVDHRLKSTSKQMEATLGLTGPQRLVVRLVGRFPGITAGRLANILHVHPSTLTGVLKRLEKRGHIERKSDPLDARKALFALTESGRALNVPSPNTVEAAVQRVLARVPRARLVATQEMLLELANELGPVDDALDESIRPSPGEARHGRGDSDEDGPEPLPPITWERGRMRVAR